MTYTPNFNDPRVLKKLRTAYGFARGCLSPTKPREWSQSALDKNLGRTNTELGAWTRMQLLVCTDNWYSMDQGKAKEYVLNQQGADFIKSVLLGEVKEENAYSPANSYLSMQQVSGQVDLFDYNVVKNWVEREHIDELRTGEFTYQDKADRLWHPLQNVRSVFRAPVFSAHGFSHDYDMVAAAPTLILQHSQHLGNDLWLAALHEYMTNRTACRERVASAANITVKEAKVLINALFCGAKLGANRDFALFHLLGMDATKVKALQADEFITQLRADIKTCWEYIEPTMTKVEVTSPKTGKTRKLPLNSKRKWARYFQLERQVMDSVRVYLNSTSNVSFCEHDGFRTKKEVNLVELQEFVLEKTGFNVKFERCKLS